MKLFTLLIFCIAVANASAVHNKENGNNIPTVTSQEPTKVKRAIKTIYEDIETFNIFKEGDKTWDENWITKDCWGNYTFEVKDGVIKAKLQNDAGFSLTNINLVSEYGVLEFDYKLEVSDGTQGNLNLVVFNSDDKYFNFNGYPKRYQGNGVYEHITQDMIDNTGNYIPKLQRFSWQNYGNNNKEITVYIKNIVYVNKKIVVIKYTDPISVLDTGKCALHSDWKDISNDTSKAKFDVVNDKCVMSIKPSSENPFKLKYLKENFKGGKIEITIKSIGSNNAFIWSAYNTNDNSIKLHDITIVANKNYEGRTEEFETEKEYNAFSISPIEGEASFEITSLIFSPIPASTSDLNYEVTYLTGPEVIYDETGFKNDWRENNWSCTCSPQLTTGAMECTFQGSYGAFSFQSNRNFNAGTLYVNMKVMYPNRMITIQVHHPNGSYENVFQIPNATNEYTDYYIPIPSNKMTPTNRFAIQEGSEQENTFYIRKVIYYASNVPIPEGGGGSTNTATTKTKTTTRRTKTSSNEPTLPPKTEEDVYNDNGYDICSQNVRVVYGEKKDEITNMYGLENDEWCAILNDKCWSVLYGVKCCSSNANVSGAWGTEPDGSKCGSNDSNACWSKELGYDCCDRSETDTIFVDEDGAWGSKNQKWCGIK